MCADVNGSGVTKATFPDPPARCMADHRPVLARPAASRSTEATLARIVLRVEKPSCFTRQAKVRVRAATIP